MLAPLFAAVALVASDADATVATRTVLQMAAGQCQPFVPTSQVRYNAAGLRNAGTSAFYAVCSSNATPENVSGVGNVATDIVLSNRASAPVWVSCTARPGHTDVTDAATQGASPKSASIGPNAYHRFSWTAADFGGVLRNPNFTCTVPPDVEINYIRTVYQEEVDAST